MNRTIKNVEWYIRRMVFTLPHLLIVAATEGEAALLAGMLDQPVRTTEASKQVLCGHLLDHQSRLAFTGMGAVNAAHTLTVQIERLRPSLVIQVGIGGAYVPSGLRVGEVAVATEEIYGDVGVITLDGWLPSDAIGIPLIPGDPPHFNRFPLDSRLVARTADACGARSGPFLTLAQCTGIRSIGDTFYERFGALCESMEGAAAAHVCALYSIPFLEIRGISNLVEDRDRSRWQIGAAARAAQEATLRVVERIDSILATT